MLLLFMTVYLSVCIVLCICTISPYTTGLKVLLNPSGCTGTAPNSQVTDIPLTGRQWLKVDPLSRSLRFFSLPLGIGPNGRGPPF